MISCWVGLKIQFFDCVVFLNVYGICRGYASTPIEFVNVMIYLSMTVALLKDWFSFKNFPYDRREYWEDVYEKK